MQPPQSPIPYNYPYTFLPSQQQYIERLLEGFNFCLSPQQLPQNMTVRRHMDEELWISIRILSKLPQLDSLLISEIMIPFVTSVLHYYARDILEVDLARQMVRPKWVLQSSVFISKVDDNATTQQVYALLDDIRFAGSCHTNPYEYRNITILRHSLNAWSIGFKSPSAGPYAAMAMRMKCINGGMILPMACVHINPPRASYTCAGIVVMEIDPVQYGAPFIPNDLVPFYSENQEHINTLYWKTMSQHPSQLYEPYFQDTPTTPWDGAGWTEPSCLEERGLVSRGGRYEQGLRSEIERKSYEQPGGVGRRGEAVSATADLATKMQVSETSCVRELQENMSIPESNSTTPVHEGLCQSLEQGGRSSQIHARSQMKRGTKAGDEANGHGEILSAIARGHGTSANIAPTKDSAKEKEDGKRMVVCGRTTEVPCWDEDVSFPNPESDSLPSPSFVTTNGHSGNGGRGQMRRPHADTVTAKHSTQKESDGNPKKVEVGFPRGDETGVRKAEKMPPQRGNPVDRNCHGRQQRAEANVMDCRRGARGPEEHTSNDGPRTAGQRRRNHRRYRTQNSKHQGGQLLTSHSAGEIRHSLSHGTAGNGERTRDPNVDQERNDKWRVISYKKAVQKGSSRDVRSGHSEQGDRGRRSYGSPSSKSVG